jgi:hypothetical protein
MKRLSTFEFLNVSKDLWIKIDMIFALLLVVTHILCVFIMAFDQVLCTLTNLSWLEVEVSGSSWFIQVLSHGVLHFVVLLQPWSCGVLVESTVKINGLFSNRLVNEGLFIEIVIVFCTGGVCV